MSVQAIRAIEESRTARPELRAWGITALVLATVLCGYGIWWGWGESWNPDEMAFRDVFNDGHFLEPSDYKKPPFHTYVNFVLSAGPFKLAQRIGRWAGVEWNVGPVMLMWSRILQVALFVGIVYLSWRIVRRYTDEAAAAAIALLTATSAGFVLQAHFLTADIPVLFWMLAAFYVAQSIVFDPRLRSYLLAGLLVGVATATKYNGLAVGLSLPIFHLYANRDRPWLSILFDRRLVAGVLLVVVGFVLANPYSVFDFKRFAADFAYNYAVTPVYNGRVAQYGFLIFLKRIPDIIGWPVTVLSAVGSLYAIFRWRYASIAERATVAAGIGVFALYFLQFGRAPRIETRFVLPVTSFVLIASAPLWVASLRNYRVVAVAVLAGVLGYNILSSIWVGKRFAEDPRMVVQDWVRLNVPARATVESSAYTPRWNRHAGVDVDDVRMPPVSGRRRVLSRVFGSDQAMVANVQSREKEADLDWYTAETLAQRRPAFVALDSMFYDRFLSGSSGGDYPELVQFLQDLMGNKLGYHAAFDMTAQQSPAWLYPQEMDFVDNRVTILARDGGS
jgi:4-amino-4-deoxy-L-arabinose transferase-like glycosyltransferase